MHEEITILLRHLPLPVQNALLANYNKQCNLDNLMELNVQIGRRPEALDVDTYTGKKLRVIVVDAECTTTDILHLKEFFQDIMVDGHKRVGIPSTLNRLSLTTHPGKDNSVITITARVGRAIVGVIKIMAPFLLPNGPSLPHFAFGTSAGASSASAFGGMFAQPLPSGDKSANSLSSKS